MVTEDKYFGILFLEKETLLGRKYTTQKWKEWNAHGGSYQHSFV